MHSWLLLLTLAAVVTSPIAGSSVDVAYAGSLVTPMESKIGPTFAQACACTYHGEGKGSVELVRLIAGGLRNPDVFISADPSLLTGLLRPKAGPALISWYATFASTHLVIGYSPKSRFAPLFARASRGEISLAALLETRDLRIGRTDPRLDPKGSRTLLAIRRLSRHFRDAALLSLAESPQMADQIFPEEDLLVRLESGDLDAAFLYATESQSRQIPALALPPDSDVTVTYAITTLQRSANRPGAAAFVRFILEGPGRPVLQQSGLVFSRPNVTGSRRDATAVMGATALGH
jgi:molybdate/tungstate transport system substrate-binding protein